MKTKILPLLRATITTVVVICTLSCSKTEPTLNSESQKELNNSITKKSGGNTTTYVCRTGQRPFPNCCGGTVPMVEICGYETRNANGEAISFNVTSVREITGNCIATCPYTEIMKEVRKIIILYMLDSEGLVGGGGGEFAGCSFEGDREFIIKTPVCAKQDPIYQGTKIVSCNPDAYCEVKMIANCTNGWMVINNDYTYPPTTVGTCPPDPSCVPLICGY